MKALDVEDMPFADVHSCHILRPEPNPHTSRTRLGHFGRYLDRDTCRSLDRRCRCPAIERAPTEVQEP